MASWLTGLVDALKEGNLQGAVEKTQTGLSGLKDNITDSIKEKAADIGAESDEIRKEKERLAESRSLPWEVPEEQSIVGEDLMERVLSLSLEETSFTQEPKPPTHFAFDMERHVQVIGRLLELDPNLTKVHYRLSAKLDERVFWRNYFHRCALLRAEVGVGNPLRRKVATKGGEAAGEGSGADSDSSKDSSGGTKSPYAGSEGELVDGVGDDDEVEGVVGRGRGGGGGPRSADEVDELAALDAEVNAELGLGLDDDLDDDDDGDDDDLDAELEAEIAAELGEDSDEE